jgi:cholestenol delta-isomerase
MASGIISNLTNPLITDHPYYPIEVEIASYLANEWSVPVLLAAFGGVCATVLLIAQIVVDKLHPNLRTSEKITIWWFILCMCPPSTITAGCIHLFFEGTKLYYNVWGR